MKKILKYILIIILIILIVFLSFTLRKYLIIHKIENNLTEVGKKTNYYIKINNEDMSSDPNDSWVIYRGFNEMNLSENGYAIFFKYSNTEFYSLFKNSKTYIISETDNSIITQENRNIDKYFMNVTENEQNTFEQIKLAVKSSIKTTDFRGNECYAISFKWIDESVNVENLTTVYIDTDSLLMIASDLVQKDFKWTTTYEIEYDTQKEDDFSKEKILEGYTIQENN